jgi:DNA-binding transcriptional ArsR family regulator
MESKLAVLAEPNRSAILMLLAAAQRTVGDIESELNLSQPSVPKHLGVLPKLWPLSCRSLRAVDCTSTGNQEH